MKLWILRALCDHLMTSASMALQAFKRSRVNINPSHSSRKLMAMSTSLSDFLRGQAERLQGEVTLGWLTAQAGSVIPGLLLVLTALPSVLPVPGVGNLTGGALVLMAHAIWRGQRCLNLPARLAGMRLSAPHAARLLRLLAWMHDAASLHLRRRGLQWVGDRGWAWAALPVAAMGVVIFLPIPLGNVFGTIALVVLGLGHALEDGLAVVAAWMLSALTLVYTVALPWGLATFGQALWVSWFSAGG